MITQSSNTSKKMHDSNIGERIKLMAKELFISYGLKSVSMDDLARLSAVSKKTIYQYYEDKNVLVHAVVSDQIQLHELLLISCHAVANEAIGEVIMWDTELFETWGDIHNRFFYEAEKYYPEAWLDLEYCRLKMRSLIIENLEWGRKEGLYRNDINTVLIAELRMQQYISLLRSQVSTTQKMSMDRLAKEITILYLRSITTEKGKLLLDNYFKKENQ